MKNKVVAVLGVLFLFTAQVAVAELRCLNSSSVQASETIVSDTLAFCPPGSMYAYALSQVKFRARTNGLKNFTLRRVFRDDLPTNNKGLRSYEQVSLPAQLKFKGREGTVENYKLVFQASLKQGRQLKFAVLNTKKYEETTRRTCEPVGPWLDAPPGAFDAVYYIWRPAYSVRLNQLFCDTSSEYAYVLDSVNVISSAKWEAVFRLIPNPNSSPEHSTDAYRLLGKRFLLSSSEPSIQIGTTVLNASVVGYGVVQLESTHALESVVPKWHVQNFDDRLCTLAIICGLLPNGRGKFFSNGCSFADSGLAISADYRFCSEDE